MTLTLGMITIDTTDALSLATWWAEQTGATVGDTHDGFFVMVSGGGLPATLAFQKVDDPTPGKNRLHLDLMVEGVDAEVDRLVGAGATLIERRGGDGFAWVTMADPDGNEFCVADPTQHG